MGNVATRHFFNLVFCLLAIPLSGMHPSSQVSIQPTLDDMLIELRAEDVKSKKFDDHYTQLLKENCPEYLRKLIERVENGNSANLPTKFLFVGPSGSGKTSLAEYLAKITRAEAHEIFGGSFATEYINSGAQNVDKFLTALMRDKTRSIAIIIDEMTTLTDKKTNDGRIATDASTVDAFWRLLDKISSNKNILLIATANDLSKVAPQIKTRFAGSTYTINNPDYKLRSKITEYYLPSFKQFTTWQRYHFLYKTSDLSVREIETILNNVVQYKSTASRLITYEDVAQTLNIFNKESKHYSGSMQEVLRNNAYWLIPFVGGIILHQIYTHQNKCFQESLAQENQQFQLRLQADTQLRQEAMNMQNQQFQANIQEQMKQWQTQMNAQGQEFQKNLQKESFDHADKGPSWTASGKQFIINLSGSVAGQLLVAGIKGYFGLP